MVSLNTQISDLQETFALPFPVRRFSVAEYEAMARFGILDEDDNVELLEGWIVPKMTKNPFHESVIGELDQAFKARLSKGYHNRIQCAISTFDSAPEPDLAVVRGTARDYRHGHPQAQDLASVIEVAESSLRRDRIKGRLYARAGIANYWIVNLEDISVEVFGDPLGADEAQYQTGTKYFPGETIETVFPDGTRISVPVSDFLTPLDAD